MVGELPLRRLDLNPITPGIPAFCTIK